MTNLEYILRKYLGPPVSNLTWYCPLHEGSRPRLEMRTPHESFKDRFKCHKCNWSGDECDIIRHFNRYANYPEQLHILSQLEKERIAMESSFPMGGTKRRTRRDDDQVSIALIWAHCRDNDGFEFLPDVAARCKAAGITVEDVIEYDREFQADMDEILQSHVLECDDPLCGDECRVARGLRPLSLSQRRHMETELEKVETERQARIKANVAKVKANIKKGKQKCQPNKK